MLFRYKKLTKGYTNYFSFLMEVILQIESLLNCQREEEYYFVPKVIPKQGETLLLGDGRIVTYEVLEESEYASQLLFALSHISDSQENDKIIALYNQEKLYLQKLHTEKEHAQTHTHIIDNMYLSMIKAWIQKFKNPFFTSAIMDEKGKHYELINKWYTRISHKIKNEYILNVQQLTSQYELVHEEMKSYVDKYVMEIEEEQIIFD